MMKLAFVATHNQETWRPWDPAKGTNVTMTVFMCSSVPASLLIYIDTSFLAPFYIGEATSVQVEAYLRSQPLGQLTISEWTQVELSV